MKLLEVIVTPQNGFSSLVLLKCKSLKLMTFLVATSVVHIIPLSSLANHACVRSTHHAPSLTLAHFPSQASSSPSTLPSLSGVLSLLLPLHVTLPLSLDLLNSARFAPESVNEDLHSGYLQLAHGTTMLMTEGGIQEGKLVDRGVLNVRTIQQVINTQTLDYKFPFSEFSFPTDISFVVLAQGSKSTLFQVRKNGSRS
jgi:Mini-chromosome maintenance replisome factor